MGISSLLRACPVPAATGEVSFSADMAIKITIEEISLAFSTNSYIDINGSSVTVRSAWRPQTVE